MAEKSGGWGERRISAVHVRTDNENVVGLFDKSIHTVDVHDDESLQIMDQQGNLIFYSTPGGWTSVYIKYADDENLKGTE